MIYEVACFLHHQRCKDILRTIQIQDIKITLLHEISEFVSIGEINQYKLLIIDSEHKYAREILKHINTRILHNSTIIVTPHFDHEVYRKYIRLGYRYIVDLDTFVYLVPTILENLAKFLQNDSSIPVEVTKRGLTISIECGYIIFHGCKISATRSELILLSALVNSEKYCGLKYLQNYLQQAISKDISTSYITVTISRLNRIIYKATGMRIIRNRYGFGYYLDI